MNKKQMALAKKIADMPMETPEQINALQKASAKLRDMMAEPQIAELDEGAYVMGSGEPIDSTFGDAMHGARIMSAADLED